MKMKQRIVLWVVVYKCLCWSKLITAKSQFCKLARATRAMKGGSVKWFNIPEQKTIPADNFKKYRVKRNPKICNLKSRISLSDHDFAIKSKNHKLTLVLF